MTEQELYINNLHCAIAEIADSFDSRYEGGHEIVDYILKDRNIPMKLAAHEFGESYLKQEVTKKNE